MKMYGVNKIFFKLLLILIGAYLSGCTNPNTPAGFEGYVYENPRVFGKGGFQGVLKGPGNFGFSFFRNEVINIDIRPNTYREIFKILAKDDLNISFSFHAVLALNDGSIQKIIENYGGTKWYTRFVQKTFRTFVRDSVQIYTSKEIKENRNLISEDVRGKLAEFLKTTPIIVKSVVVGNIDYPEIVAQAVEKKLAAQQLLAEKETQREIAKKDAEIRVEEAKGIAQAQKIINATLTINYLRHEAIQAQIKMANSPNHTTVYIPSGPNGIPMIESIRK